MSIDTRVAFNLGVSGAPFDSGGAHPPLPPAGSAEAGAPKRRKQPGRRAQILSDEQLNAFLGYMERNSAEPVWKKLCVLLGSRAGLRVSQVQALRMSDVTDPEGSIAKFITIRSGVGKGGRSRTIPMHPEIKQALVKFCTEYPASDFFAVPSRGPKDRPTSVGSLTVGRHWLEQAGLHGCSSHGGRRTFVTQLARTCNQIGALLRDVQLIAGHARLETTAAHIGPGNTLGGLVRSVGKSKSASRASSENGGEA